MSMIICSISNLKKIHEETKKYKCYKNLLDDQVVILADIEKYLKEKELTEGSITEEERDTVCIEYWEYDSFKRAIPPEDVIDNAIKMFGKDIVLGIIKEKYNLN